MHCEFVKPGKDCFFMGKRGCGFGASSETCQPVVDKCDGCGNVEEWPSGKYCSRFAAPASKWQFGICNMATHVKIEEKKDDRKINPLKASKRAARK